MLPLAETGSRNDRDLVRAVAGRARSAVAVAGFLFLAGKAMAAQTSFAVLPEAPSALLMAAQEPAQTTPPATLEEPSVAVSTAPAKRVRPPRCGDVQSSGNPEAAAAGQSRNVAETPCREENPLQTIVESKNVRPLLPDQKARLAIHDVFDPFNLVVLMMGSGVSVATNAHGPYGPGMAGFGRTVGYSLEQDIQGEFFATFLIPVIAHEDPRYHRMGGKNIPARALHAILHTYVSQHDDGRIMPNYATLLNYPIAAELANIWIPGTPVNARSTANRVVLGYAFDPTGTLIGEFLPDVARHIHVHSVFLQQQINRFAGIPNVAPVQP